ncbi:MAG: efflux RND transporter periplasmic adaptor subunit [Candidatus Coatesbacteria bacterium]|nr:efflux RND transporter periplasmic adaptor subunit [Candidatus Coatesbacteria bacterium]
MFKFLLLILACLILSCGKKNKTDEKTNIKEIKPDFVIKSISSRKIPIYAESLLRSLHIATIESPIGGKINEITVKLGTRVKKGALLGELDNALVKANFEKTKSEIERMQSELTSFQQQLVQIVKKYGVGDQSRDMQNEIDALIKEINEKKSDLQDLELEIKSGQILSPIKGEITGIYKQPGQVIVKGDKLFIIEDNTTLTGSIELSEQDATNYNEGDAVNIIKNDEEFQGTITLVHKEAGFYKAIFEVEGRRLKSGMIVKVPLSVKKLELVAIPKYLLLDGYVWIIKDMQSFKEKVKIMDEDQNNIYTSSYQIGTVIIDGHNNSLKDGQVVKVLH